MRRRQSFSLLTVFWISFCSMVCHPISVAMFFYCAYTVTMPNLHMYMLVAFFYALSVRKTMRSLGEINVPRLVRKAVSFAE